MCCWISQNSSTLMEALKVLFQLLTICAAHIVPINFQDLFPSTNTPGKTIFRTLFSTIYSTGLRCTCDILIKIHAWSGLCHRLPRKGNSTINVAASQNVYCTETGNTELASAYPLSNCDNDADVDSIAAQNLRFLYHQTVTNKIHQNDMFPPRLWAVYKRVFWKRIT